MKSMAAPLPKAALAEESEETSSSWSRTGGPSVDTCRDGLHMDIVWDHYIYAQASLIAIAVVEADSCWSTYRGEFKGHARVGDPGGAGKVGVHKEDKYIVSVARRSATEVFAGGLSRRMEKDLSRNQER